MNTIRLRTLDGISIDELLETFNEAFSDYVIKMSLTRSMLESKIQAESIDLSLSAGAFAGKRLVGFILHGIDKGQDGTVAYNAATGVIPAHRGKKLTYVLYKFILPVLKHNGIHSSRLEVIDSNEAAIRSYKSVGFTITRKLDCFKGNPMPAINEDISLTPVSSPAWELLSSFWDFTPTWQNSIATIKNLGSRIKITGVMDHDQLAGYIAFTPHGRILQLAVKKELRNRGYGKALLHHAARCAPDTELSIINVDGSAHSTVSFLTSCGMQSFISQYEMEMDI